MKKVLILGGTGFLGKFIVKELVNLGYSILLLSRTENNLKDILTLGFPGQIIHKKYDINNNNLFVDVLSLKFDAIINLIGIGKQIGKNYYHNIHVEIPSKIASFAYKQNIRFVHISAFIPESNSKDILNNKYAQTKIAGESAILKMNPNAVIVRPSVIIGQGSTILKEIEFGVKYSPFFPMLNGGKGKIQPVYAGDVALFVAKAANYQISSGIYTICGEEPMQFKELVERVMGFMNILKPTISMPYFFFSTIFAAQGLLPNKFTKGKITTDIAKLGMHDSICKAKHNNIHLALPVATKVDAVLFNVFAKYRLYD